MRRESFCTSQLPSTVHLFDRYFSLNYPLPLQRVIRYASTSTSSSDHSAPLFTAYGAHSAHSDGEVAMSSSFTYSLAAAQVDGPAERKRVKKKEKRKKKKEKKKTSGSGSGKQDESGDETQNENEKESVKSSEKVEEKKKLEGDAEGKASQSQSQTQTQTRSSSEKPDIYLVYGAQAHTYYHPLHGNVHRINPEPEHEHAHTHHHDRSAHGAETRTETGTGAETHHRPGSPASSSATVRAPVQREENVQDDNDDGMMCRVHRRLLCQFNDACCVHKPVSAGCRCPMKYSCCCMHHSGDCCECRAGPFDTPPGESEDFEIEHVEHSRGENEYEKKHKKTDESRDQGETQTEAHPETESAKQKDEHETQGEAQDDTNKTQDETWTASAAVDAPAEKDKGNDETNDKTKTGDEASTTEKPTRPTVTTSSSTCATVSHPAKPSGVEITLTPSSPTDADFTADRPYPGGGAESAVVSMAASSIDLSSYLLNMMANDRFTDFHLTLRSATDLFFPVVMPVHKLIISRSPLVASLFPDLEYVRTPGIVAIAGESFSMIQPWELVIQHLYGKPGLTPTTLKAITLDALGYIGPNRAEACDPFDLLFSMLDMAILCATTGTFFDLRHVTEMGFGLVLDLLDWDTVEFIMIVGLRIHRFAVTLQALPLLRTPPQPTATAGFVPSLDTVEEVHEIEDVSQESEKADENAGVSEGSGGTASSSTATTTRTTATAAAHMGSGSDTIGASVHPARPQELPFPLAILQNEWSMRITNSALNFVIDNLEPDFQLYSAATSRILPDRIPEYLTHGDSYKIPTSAMAAAIARARARARARAAAKAAASATAAEAATGTETGQATSSSHESAAVANNPRLASVKFGSFTETKKSGEKTETEIKEDDGKGKGKGKEKETEEYYILDDMPPPEIFIPSAIFLMLPFAELELAFKILSSRGIMTSSLAQAVIVEREARRLRALRKYTDSLLASEAASEAASSSRATSSSENDSAKEEKKDHKPAKKARFLSPKTAADKRYGDKERRPGPRVVRAVDVPPAVLQLCFREFYSSKMRAGVGSTSEEVDVEITLEREYVGFDCY